MELSKILAKIIPPPKDIKEGTSTSHFFYNHPFLGKRCEELFKKYVTQAKKYSPQS